MRCTATSGSGRLPRRALRGGSGAAAGTAKVHIAGEPTAGTPPRCPGLPARGVVAEVVRHRQEKVEYGYEIIRPVVLAVLPLGVGKPRGLFLVPQLLGRPPQHDTEQPDGLSGIVGFRVQLHEE